MLFALMNYVIFYVCVGKIGCVCVPFRTEAMLRLQHGCS